MRDQEIENSKQPTTQKIYGVQCIKVESDIDYFKELGAHTLLEVIPNAITHGLTDPKKVYVLRWIVGPTSASQNSLPHTPSPSRRNRSCTPEDRSLRPCSGC